MMAQAEQCGTGGCVGSFPLPSGLKIKLARSRYAVALPKLSQTQPGVHLRPERPLYLAWDMSNC